MTCIKCFTMDEMHWGHRFILINDLLSARTEDLEQIFSPVHVQQMHSGLEISHTIHWLIGQIDFALSDSEQRLKEAFQSRVTQNRQRVGTIKQRLYSSIACIGNIKGRGGILERMQQMVENGSSLKEQLEMRDMIMASASL